MKKYFTKSDFQVAITCPTKLFYETNKEYFSNKVDNPFLESLAEGGYQVGALAKAYYPEGIEIEAKDPDLAINQTNELLKKDEVVLFEPAFQFDNLLARIDILVKKGNHIEIFEVKAKSYDSNEDRVLKVRGIGVLKEWEPYISDVTFQRHVLRNALSEFEIKANLTFVDKSKPCHVDGLNQKFVIISDDSHHKGIRVSSNLSREDLREKVLVDVNVDSFCDVFIETKEDVHGNNFFQMVKKYSKAFAENSKFRPKITSGCSDCEFRPKNPQNEQINGYAECLNEVLGINKEEVFKDCVLDIWNFKSKDKLLSSNKFFLDEVDEDDINPGDSRNKHRQWIQIYKSQSKDDSVYLDKVGLKEEMDSWKYPFHFIDFETASVALPFNEGKRPYEAIAFQFSHHKVDEDGTITHANEFISTNKGEFPNFEFLKHLKNALGNDDGTIFKYSSHENTILARIHMQIIENNLSEQYAEYLEFIKSITHSPREYSMKWRGDRDMVDLLDVVINYYYNPKTKGSNSLKAVLPSTLASSEFLQTKYSKPIYGTPSMLSKNFTDKTWIQFKDGEILDPYASLGDIFKEDQEYIDSISGLDEIKEGGAAMIAYSRMQFDEMSLNESNELKKALLKYCELDTLAMVMLYEALKDWMKDV